MNEARINCYINCAEFPNASKVQILGNNILQ